VNDLLPKHPRYEGLVFAFFFGTLTGYAALLIYVLARWAAS
jgi:hypothetical protein